MRRRLPTLSVRWEICHCRRRIRRFYELPFLHNLPNWFMAERVLLGCTWSKLGILPYLRFFCSKLGTCKPENFENKIWQPDLGRPPLEHDAMLIGYMICVPCRLYSMRVGSHINCRDAFGPRANLQYWSHLWASILKPEPHKWYFV